MTQATQATLPANLKKQIGVILYEGPSKLDGQPIVVIATGLKKSSNRKTGAMIQTYILRADVHPIEAVKTGQDASICGDCKHRGDGTGKGRSCYVTLMHGPRVVFDAYQRGVYPKVDAFTAATLFADKMVRLGTYGDPAAAPRLMWKVVTSKAEGWTGYTHQWRSINAKWAELVMASADSEADMTGAHDLGYRTFRVTSAPFENIKGKEAVCPASEEKGKVAQCITCKACMGTSGKANVSIQIAAHGTGQKYV
tara:strand:- start:3351 stop:4109 length:759 start_codon:yes stop_codon:yes gene_type:complete